jgi:hypothetical protein
MKPIHNIEHPVDIDKNGKILPHGHGILNGQAVSTGSKAQRSGQPSRN